MGITQFSLHKMYVFIDMVITRIKNGSPDMISMAFEGKFDEKKDEIPPRICRPHMLQIIQYWGFWGLTKNTKMIRNGVPGGPHGSEFGMYLSTISPNICLNPKVFNFN